MVSADYLMKRIAMDLDRSPVANLPSYLQLLHRGSGTAQPSAPRWWLAPDYETVEKSTEAMAWRFQGRGIQTLSEHGYLNPRGDLVNAGSPSPLGKLWADKFTDAYDELGRQLPVFSQLPSDCDDELVFFGGLSYLPLSCQLTHTYQGRRFVFYASGGQPSAPNCILGKYNTTDFRNWHYRCARDFMNGTIGI